MNNLDKIQAEEGIARTKKKYPSCNTTTDVRQPATLTITGVDKCHKDFMEKYKSTFKYLADH